MFMDRRPTVHFQRSAPAMVLVFALMVLCGCGLRGPAYADNMAPGVDHVVDLGLRSYSPAQITVKQGETIEWRNNTVISHTVTAVPGEAKNSVNVALPEGAEPFDSGNIEAGQVFRYTFTVPGTYRYFCRPHELYGMVGSVIVE